MYVDNKHCIYILFFCMGKDAYQSCVKEPKHDFFELQVVFSVLRRDGITTRHANRSLLFEWRWLFSSIIEVINLGDVFMLRLACNTVEF